MGLFGSNQQTREVVDIINKIKDTSSTNEKQNILKDNLNNELLKRVLFYTYNASTYKITKEVITPYVVEFSEYNDDIFKLLDKLATNNINDELRNEVGVALGSLEQSIGELLLNMMTKDLRCGISDKTINKVWKGLIPSWEVQQAYPIDSSKLKKDELIILSEKLNGSRGSYLNGSLISRQGKEFNGLNHIIDDLKKAGLEDFFIDGELIRDNLDNISDNENFRESMSILSEDSLDRKSQIVFTIYDMMPREEFLNGQSKHTYSTRIKQLKHLSDRIGQLELKNIKVLPILYIGRDHEKIKELLDWVDNNNKEGIMLYRDVPYKCKRHKGILKVKSFKHCDVKCIDTYEGTGKYEGMLGGIVVDYKGFKCGVGSGFDDATRKMLWDKKEKIINKIVQIKYKEESKNKDGGLSMQFPVFEVIREDKTEESYN